MSQAVAPQPSSRPDEAPPQEAQSTSESSGSSGSSEVADVRAGSATAAPVPLRATLRRLAIVGALACALNGVAGYWVAQGDLGSTQAVLDELDGHVQQVSRVVTEGESSARSARAGGSVEAHRAELASGAESITAASARAATGPDDVTADVTEYHTLAGAYVQYVGALEAARSAPADQAEAAFADAERVRQDQVQPVLSELAARGEQRAEAAGVASAVAYGVLTLSTLASLGTLLWGSGWLARRTKRVVNPGLVGGALVTGATSAYAFATLADPSTLSGEFTGPALLLGGLTAAGLTWTGVSRRLKEYR